MKRILLIIAIITAVLALAGCSGRVYEFGYVDMQKITTESAKLQSMQEQMEEKIKQMQEVDAQESSTLSAEDFAKNRQIRQSELMTIQRDFENEFMSSLNTAMEEVAKEKKLGAILIKGSVMHGGIDVTDEVLQRMK